jgi:hydroxymethylbilane synthase
MEGGCQVPIAGFAKVNEHKEITFTGLIASPDGTEIYKQQLTGKDPIVLGEDVSTILTEQGAKSLIDRVKAELDS